jgi:rhamnosyltransferase subunit B
MRFLLSALGSAGDVHPFIAIGQSLRARGHDVRIVASPPFEARVRAAGIDFAPLGEPGDFERVVARAELWDARRGTRLVFDELLRRLPEAYATIAALVESGRPTVLVGSTLSWGMRLVQDRTGLPGATIHLSPACLWSAIRPPVLPGIGDLARLPVWVRRLLQRVVERGVLDRWLGPPLDRLRADLHLPPVRNVWSRWTHSPDLVIGAWPDWFAPAEDDWPPHTRTVGFPLFAERESPLAADLDAFLAAGPPPVGITPGSAMAHGERFFAQALAACEALGLRALLITPYREQLPATLPAWASHVAYAPFTALLPRLSALVHHGGIGTSAQALAAGKPQLVVPFAHDQFDNAARLERLGVARQTKADAPLTDWTTRLRAVTEDAAIDAATRQCAGRIAETGAAQDKIARMLERLGSFRRDPSAPPDRMIDAERLPRDR